MSTRRTHTGSYSSLLWPLLLALAGGLLRGLRLAWQPLWWDEGYSVYFATEPLSRMLHLTALDIHPPLYYALLHDWLSLFGNAHPLTLRAFSVLVGALTIPAFWWLIGTLFPGRPRLALLGTALLAISPMHLFYSQEVRMYGLEMLLGILSTGFFWQMMQAHALGRRRWAAGGYVLATVAALYTEYYVVLLPLAHLVWAAWTFRRRWRKLLPLLLADGAIGLAYLPWLLYAVPDLVPYVSQKIVADNDSSLHLWAYVVRHLLAFTTGHVQAAVEGGNGWTRLLQPAGLLGIGLLLAVFGYCWLASMAQPRPQIQPVQLPSFTDPRRHPRATILLVFSLILPAVAGFVLNLRLPFFPQGGERVLLFVLPYFLLLLAFMVDSLWRSRRRLAQAGGFLGLAGLLLSASAGIFVYYTVPRYTENDYRPLIRQVVQQGRDEDTVFAVFPWQLGYWRAYALVWGKGETHGPWPLLSPSPAWNDDVADALDEALARGKLWLPAHLALGGILEGKIEAYLAAESINFTNRWYSATTRLSGWQMLDTVPSLPNPIDAHFGPVQLAAAGVVPVDIASANQVVQVDLTWRSGDGLPGDPLRVTLRLLDEQGRVWASRDYEPLGIWATAGQASGSPAGAPAEALVEEVGLLVPTGLPPGRYSLSVGVGPAVEQAWLYPVRTATGTTDVVPVASVQVTEPIQALPPLRLPIQSPLTPVVERDGVVFLGFSGYDPAVPTLAGTELALSLFLQNQATNLSTSNVYISLLGEDGNGVAGWEGWPLPDYPMDAWLPGALVRLPISFYLPASLPAGDYQLIAGLLDPRSGTKSAPLTLGTLAIIRREADFTPPRPQQPLTPPVQFGTHALLIGYDLSTLSKAEAPWVETATPADSLLELTLYWQVLQTLLPPHQVFVHLVGPDGRILAQDDGVPGEAAVAAPSGSWLPGEYIIDPHRLPLPSHLPPGSRIEVGLYLPESGVRLPSSRNGASTGDAAVIPLPD